MSAPSSPCARCGRSIGKGFLLKGGGSEAQEKEAPRWTCLRCSLVDRSLVGRSTRVAIVVGSILVALNQGDQLLAGTFPFETRWWKLPLTFVVPFCVAMYGALSNGYRPSPPILDKAK